MMSKSFVIFHCPNLFVMFLFCMLIVRIFKSTRPGESLACADPVETIAPDPVETEPTPRRLAQHDSCQSIASSLATAEAAAVEPPPIEMLEDDDVESLATDSDLESASSSLGLPALNPAKGGQKETVISCR